MQMLITVPIGEIFLDIHIFYFKPTFGSLNVSISGQYLI